MRKLKVFLMLCSALVLVSTLRAQNSGTNNAELNGDYAFTFNGFSGSSSGTSSVFAIVGRFTADGAGNVTNGELDTNGVDPGATRVAQTFTGTYSIGADHRGVMNIGGGPRFAFAMMANGNAQFIEFDAGGGSGTIGSGTMEKADPAAYATTKITGDYAFGVSGLDPLNNRAAMSGRFSSDGAGTLSNANGDLNAFGAFYQTSFTTASYTVSDTTLGRGTMNLSFTFATGASASLNFAFYIVNSGKLFVMERDTVTTATPLLSGSVLQQQRPAGGFTNASLSGRMVIYLTGLSPCGGPKATVPKAVIGLFTFDGNGGFTLTYDENFCNAANSVNASGTYTVESDGRTSIMFGPSNVLNEYLVNLNQAFQVGTDDNVLFGFGEPQQAISFTSSDVKGTYAGSTTTPAGFGVVVFSGEFTADGGSPNGNIVGTADVGSPAGSISGVTFNATYSVSSSPTNGRSTMTITSGSGGSDFVYVISTWKFVAVSSSDPNPAVLIFEQASSSIPPPVPPSITTQPANQTVTAGQTATFNVTATGTAPLSYQWRKNGSPIGSANSASYTTPATTTDDNGAQFTVVVSNSAGSETSNAATLTVNSAPVPPSITTQPASQTVTAGQTATFTVTASGTAPLSYQWRKNGSPIGGANSASYTTPPTTTGDNGAQFTVVVSNSAGSATSNAATLTVNSAPVPPTITTQPANRTVTAGQTATFTVTATGTAPLSYQWRKNGSPIGGANSSSYTTPATTTADNGAQFTVVVSNSAGSATSNAATLTVNAPSFTLTVNNQSGVLGSGSVTSNPAGINCGSACAASYVSGTTVILTAHPDFLSSVGSWTGCDAISGGGTTCTVNMNASRTVSVSFRFLM